ncbi:hypothetical protein GGI18_001490 [Coemansia linderi]|uniref:Uncharacterized protein n=1 Tax=Coemansia linderi TaxID=2663919 RepID=A0ACC1KK00_9FUNG|nr:hypothetical protein GGI18_001490 [Coemansia linderi]
MNANPRGIPQAPFVDNVGEYLKTDSVEATIRKFTEAASKYKFMENSKLQQRGSLEQKIPEIEKTLATINYLVEQQETEEPIKTLFEINDTLGSQDAQLAAGRGGWERSMFPRAGRPRTSRASALCVLPSRSTQVESSSSADAALGLVHETANGSLPFVFPNPPPRPWAILRVSPYHDRVKLERASHCRQVWLNQTGIGSESITSSAGRYAKGSFTQLWEYVFSNAFLSTQTYGVHYDASANFAPNMNLPLLSAGPWDPDAAEARLLGKVVEVESIAEPMTIASIRYIAPMIRSVNFDRLTKGDKETHAPMIIRLEQVYNDALAQKNELDAALHNLPPTYNLTFRHKDEPELSTPFKCWHSTRSTRALLQRVDPAPAFPKTDLDQHFSLLPVSRNSSEWALTESINALPQARSTLKRLLHKRMPVRQGHITTCICAPAGTPAPRETVHHMLVECPAAKPFSSELFPKWIRLAQKLKPTVLYEHNIASLQPDADGCVYKLPPPASLPAELPTAPPSTELIPMAPFLKWLAFAVPTETAEHFHQLWQLASSTLIQLLWLQRNDLAYSEDRWSQERFITAYNSELTRYAQASTPPSSVVMRHLKEVLLDEPPPPTRRRHRHDSSPATVRQPAVSMQGNSPRSLQPPEPTPPTLDLLRFDPTDPD